jgi:hypothetical protein
MSIAKLVAMLYIGAAMPFNTHRWETTVLFRGATYVVGVRTPEIFIFHEIYGWLQYNRHTDFIPQSGWTVFDVGANIGVFTLLQATQGAGVYAFEPNPDSYGRLLRNVTANKLNDCVRLFPMALGDERGMGSLHVIGGGTTRRRGDTGQGAGVGVRNRGPDSHARRSRFHAARIIHRLAEDSRGRI